MSSKPKIKTTIDQFGNVVLDLSDFPQEFIDYAFDQFPDRFSSEQSNVQNAVDEPEIKSDCQKGKLSVTCIAMEVMQLIVEEKLANMNSKLERTERDWLW